MEGRIETVSLKPPKRNRLGQSELEEDNNLKEIRPTKDLITPSSDNLPNEIELNTTDDKTSIFATSRIHLINAAISNHDKSKEILVEIPKEKIITVTEVQTNFKENTSSNIQIKEEVEENDFQMSAIENNINEATKRTSISSIVVTKKSPSVTKKPSFRTLHSDDIPRISTKAVESITKKQSYRSLDIHPQNRNFAQNQLSEVPEENLIERKAQSNHHLGCLSQEQTQDNTYDTHTEQAVGRKKITACHCTHNTTPNLVPRNNSFSFESSVDNLLKSTECLQEVTKLNKNLSQVSKNSAKPKSIVSEDPILMQIPHEFADGSVETVNKDIYLNPVSTDQNVFKNIKSNKSENSGHFNDESLHESNIKSKSVNKSSFKEILPKRDMLVSQDLTHFPVADANENTTDNSDIKQFIASFGKEELPNTRNLSEIPEPIEIDRHKQENISEKSPVAFKSEEKTYIPSLSVDLPLAPQPSVETQNQQKLNIPIRLRNSAEERKKSRNILRTLNKDHLEGQTVQSSISDQDNIRTKPSSPSSTDDDSIIAIHSNVGKIMTKSDLVQIQHRSGSSRPITVGTWGTTLLEEGLSPDFWIHEPTHKVEFFIGVFVVTVMSFLYFMMYFWLYIMKMLAVAAFTLFKEHRLDSERQPSRMYTGHQRSKDYALYSI